MAKSTTGALKCTGQQRSSELPTRNKQGRDRGGSTRRNAGRETRVGKIGKAQAKTVARTQLNAFPVAGSKTLKVLHQPSAPLGVSPEVGNYSTRKSGSSGNAQYVPVVSSSGSPLMPCHPARARELVRKGRALTDG